MPPARPFARALLPPPTAGWPVIVGMEADAPPACARAGDAAAALARIRDETIYWPAPRRAAVAPRALALDRAGLAMARAGYHDSDVLLSADAQDAAPDRLEAVFGAGAPAVWAHVGGLVAPAAADVGDPETQLAAASARCPWTGAPMSLAEALDALVLLRRAACRARGPVALVGMSPWKRRCLRPFLTGPDGPPRRARRIPDGAPVAVWGGEVGAPIDALRVEDGFLRSVGQGLRHTPPVSLAIAPGPPHFDATRPNAFERLVADTTFDEALLDRAARLRRRIVAMRLTKYNLPDRGALPDTGGREAVLATGQVAGDASIRLGARLVRDDLGLLEAARARFPDAYILYKPHPDVVSGLRRGAAPPEVAARLADRVETAASAAECLDWADRVVAITSQTGFEALLRGKAVTTLGRPFYAGWGLTDDLDPPPRPRSLSLDALCAAALILHASYVDPVTGLPCPPEIAIERLAVERAGSGRLAARLRRLWRLAASWTLNRI